MGFAIDNAMNYDASTLSFDNASHGDTAMDTHSLPNGTVMVKVEAWIDEDVLARARRYFERTGPNDGYRPNDRGVASMLFGFADGEIQARLEEMG